MFELQEAAWIASSDDIGVGGPYVVDLSFPKIHCGFGLSEIIDAGAPTTPRAFREFGELSSGDEFE